MKPFLSSNISSAEIKATPEIFCESVIVALILALTYVYVPITIGTQVTGYMRSVQINLPIHN